MSDPFFIPEIQSIYSQVLQCSAACFDYALSNMAKIIFVVMTDVVNFLKSEKTRWQVAKQTPILLALET